MDSSSDRWLPPCKGWEDLNRQPSLADFERVSKLGKGAYGQVFKVKLKGTEKEYAMKVISKQTIVNLKMIDQLKNEFNILRRLNHPNIIKLIAYFEDDRNIYFLLELADDDHLYARLNKVEKYDEPTAAKYIHEMFQACNYLHTQDPPIIHRDIKPENILFVKGSLKLADFGWSNMKESKVRNTYCGTPDYLAPEMVLEKPHNEKLDVWTLGVLLYELVVGKAPFTPSATIKDRRLQQKELTKNIIEVKLKFPPHVSTNCINLIKRLLQKDYRNRPSCGEALLDPFFTTNGLKWTEENSTAAPSGATTPRTDSQFASPSKQETTAKQKNDDILNASTKIVDKNISESGLQSMGNSASSLSNLLKKLPAKLQSDYSADSSVFMKNLMRDYIHDSSSLEQIKSALDVTNKAMARSNEEALKYKAVTKLLSSDGKDLTVEAFQKKVMDLKQYKTLSEELQQQLAAKGTETSKLNDRIAELERALTEAGYQKDELAAQKGRAASELENIKQSQIELEIDLQKEIDTLSKNNKNMEELLSNNPQTRPGVIQTSLLKVIDVLDDINHYYLKSIKPKDAPEEKEAESVQSLTLQKVSLEKKIAALQKEMEAKLAHERNTAELEHQARFKKEVEEYKSKRDQEVFAMSKKIDEMLSAKGDYILLKDQLEQLKKKVEDREQAIKIHKSTEESLQFQIREAKQSYTSLEEAFVEMMGKVESLKAQGVSRVNMKS